MLKQAQLKFFVSTGEYFKQRLQGYPYAQEFVSSRLLVVCTDGADKIAGVCGIRSLFNIAVLYISKDYRGYGIGTRLLSKAVKAAEKRPPNFVSATIAAENDVILHILLKLRFRQVLFLEKSRQRLMVSSSTFMGKLAGAVFRVIGLAVPNYVLSFIHSLFYIRTV